MSINEKKKRPLNDAQSSHRKLVSRLDEPFDVVQVAKPRIEQSHRPVQQEAGRRLLRDATVFYKNDTSNFLGELQKVETMLHQKCISVSKIDFLPPKRKTSPKENPDAAQGNGIDHLLSDTGVVSIPHARQKKHKWEAPEKLIVDVNDFVETFSAFREPVYLQGKRKNPPEPEAKSDVESLLDQVQLRRKKDKTRKPLELESDSPEHDIRDDVANRTANTNDCPISDAEVLPLVVASAPDAVTHNEPAFEYGIADEICELRSEVADIHPVIHFLSEIAAKPEYSGQTVVNTLTILPLNELPPKSVKDNRNHDVNSHDNEGNIPETVIPEKVETTNATVETELPDEAFPDPVEPILVAEDQTRDIAANEIKTSRISRRFVCELPRILERLEEIAGDQCDSLTNSIKDKVYDGSRLIAFCGMKRSGGCSTMTLLAAKGIARHGLKTAVIDANFEFPQLNAMMTGQRNEQDNQASWVNILHGAVDWETLGVTPKGMPLLTIFPLAENALVNWSQHEPERLQQETNRLVSTLHDHFDVILLDCGCFDEACEEITWGELALFQPDGVILVHNPKVTPLEQLEPCCREILGSGMGAYGVAENFSKCS